MAWHAIEHSFDGLPALTDGWVVVLQEVVAHELEGERWKGTEERNYIAA